MVSSTLTMRCRFAVTAALVAAWMMAGCAAAPAASKKPAGGKPAANAKPASPAGKSSGLKFPRLTGGSYATTFAIQCMEAQGPDGARMVDLMAKGLRSAQGFDPNLVQTQTKGKTSSLFYGAYRGEVKKDADQFSPPEKAKQDLAIIRSMASGQAQPFQLASIVEAPTPDPGPAEWNLKNAPGVYTLQITYVFDKPGLPNHKDVVVEICKTLREQGEEAWYLHNDRISVVTVGHFEESAIEKDPEGKPLRYSPSVVALQNKREEFKYNTECLRKVVRVIGNQRVPAPSTLIPIPNDSARPQRPPTPPPKIKLSTPEFSSPSGEVPPPARAFVSCDLQVIKVADGTVAATAAGEAGPRDLDTLATILCKKVKDRMPVKGASIAVASFRDRTASRKGRTAADQLADKVAAALAGSGWFEVRARLDLPAVSAEKDLEGVDLLKNPEVKGRLSGVSYVVIAGVTLSEPEGQE